MGMGYPKLQREDSPDQKEVLSHLESQVALLLKAWIKIVFTVISVQAQRTLIHKWVDKMLFQQNINLEQINSTWNT